MRRSLIKEDELVPRRKSVVLVFSVERGSCFASARFERAFLGLLVSISGDRDLIEEEQAGPTFGVALSWMGRCALSNSRIATDWGLALMG